MPITGSPSPKRYVAFISYSHRDRKWAEWLHRAIETYRVPKGIVRTVDAGGAGSTALRPVFLDRAELPSSADLAASVREALDESAFLIVVCSPHAAKSRWVDEEIRTFKALGRGSRILCLIVGGEPLAGSAPSNDNNCFPAALRFLVHDGQVTNEPAPEPLAADLRDGKDERRMARLKIVAGLLGVPFDRLRQRDQTRRQQRLAFIAAASAVGCLAFGALAIAALYARNEANRQRVIAEQRSLTARRTADFLKSLFVVSDPGEARGNSITAREVLDRGVRQIDEQLKDEPLVRADLTAQLGEVYASLGLLKEGENLLKNANAVAAQPNEIAAVGALYLGEVQYQRGEYEAALASLQHAATLYDRSENKISDVRNRLLVGLGNVYNSKNDFGRARRYFHEALALTTGTPAQDREMAARALEGIAQADFYDDRIEQAATEFLAALQARVALSGDLHPQSIEILDALGSVEYMRGNRPDAIKYYKRALASEKRVLGENDPEIGATLNNIGRVLLEERKFDDARRILQESVDRKSQVSDTDDLAAFSFSNLALADAELGDYLAAEPLFQKGLQNAIANKHRLHGPILTDLADLECRTGRYDQGLTRLNEARPIVAARYPDDPWRVAHVDNVRAGCLTGLKRYAEAEKLIESSDPIVLKKWRPDTLYGYDALQRTMRLYSLTGNTAKLAEYRKLAGK